MTLYEFSSTSDGLTAAVRQLYTGRYAVTAFDHHAERPMIVISMFDSLADACDYAQACVA